MSKNFIMHIRRETTAKNERRVSFIPTQVARLLRDYSNLQIQVESEAGLAAGFSDEDYKNAGARIVGAEAARNSHLCIAVKGTGPGQDYGCYDIRFHHGANCNIEGGLEAVNSGAGLITLDQDMKLPEASFDSPRPVLVAMSDFTGRLSATWLKEFRPKAFKNAKVVIFGGGVLGRAAFDKFINLGIPESQIFVGDINDTVLETYPEHCRFRTDDRKQFLDAITGAYFAVGAVLIPGKKSPCVFTSKDWSIYSGKGAVAIDPANDQGGCFEGAQLRVKKGQYTTFDKRFGNWTPNRFISVVPNMPSAGGAESSELFGEALMKMLPHMFNVEDWSPNRDCINDALLALDGTILDDAFSTRVSLGT